MTTMCLTPGCNIHAYDGYCSDCRYQQMEAHCQKLEAVLRMLVEVDEKGYCCCDFNMAGNDLVHEGGCPLLAARAALEEKL